MKTKRKHNSYVGIWQFKHFDKNGKLKEEWETQNALADEGEENILDSYFRGQNAPTQFYVSLVNDTPVETDTLTDLLNEPSGNGYARVLVERSSVGFPTLALDSGDFRLTSKSATFTASGGNIPGSGNVTYAVLGTTSDNTGKLIAYVALSQGRNILAGESLQITMYIKLQ